MLRIALISIAIVSTMCFASELLEKSGFYPESMAEVKSPEQAVQRSEQEQQLAKLRKKSAQLQTSFTAADLTNAQSVSFIFDADNKQVTMSVPYDSIWRAQKRTSYHIPSAPYNYAAMELFRTLIYKKTKEEVAQFWKDFFKLKFTGEAVDFAQVRDSLFDLIDATQAQDVLLSGLFIVTVPKDSVWRLKTVDNMRGLPNGDVLYYIIDENYDQKTIKLFSFLVQQKTKEEVEQFWRDFDLIDTSKKEIIKEQLLSIISHAGAQEALLAGLLYSIQFQLNKNIVDTIPIDQKQIPLFGYLKTLLEDIKDVRIIPISLDNTDIDAQKVAEIFKLMLQYLSLAQAKIDAVNKMQNFVGDKEARILREISYACIGTYRDISLELIVQSLALALYLGLQQPYSTYLGDVYVNKLMESKFNSQAEFLKALPMSSDVDTFVVKIMMQKLLAEKYLYSEKKQRRIIYMGMGGQGMLQKIVFHEDSFFPDPYYFIRATESSGIYVRTDNIESLSQRIRSIRYKQMQFSIRYGLDMDVFDIELFGENEAVVVTKDKIKIVRANSTNPSSQLIEEGMSQKLPASDATDGSIRRLSGDRFCVGSANYIILFSIKNSKIVDFKPYTLETPDKGIVSDLFVLDDMVAVSYKTLTGEYKYFFFDVNNGGFVKEPYNALEIKFMHTQSGSTVLYKKMIILVRDKDLCINRSLIMNARGFTKLDDPNGVVALYIDSAQDNIYFAFKEIGLVEKYEIIPMELKYAIDAINNAEKALRGKEKRPFLTLDMLYFIAHKYAGMVALDIKKLENLVSAPMKAALQPTLSNKAKSAYFSWSDVFKSKLKKFALGLGLAGVVAYFSSKARNLYTPAAYGKIKIPNAAAQ